MNFSTIKITGNHVRINVVNMNNSFVEIIWSKIDTNAVINDTIIKFPAIFSINYKLIITNLHFQIPAAETVTGTKPKDRHVGQPHTVEDKKHPDAKTESKKSSKMASSSWGVRMSRSSFNRKKSGR